MIDSALDGVSDPIVDVYIDASEFEGWALRAAWGVFMGTMVGIVLKLAVSVGILVVFLIELFS